MVFGDLRGSTWSGACMTDCSDYHSRHQANSLTTLVALRPHKVRDGRSIPDLGSFNSVAHHNFDSELKDPAYLPDLLYGEPNVLPVQIWNAQTILKIT